MKSIIKCFSGIFMSFLLLLSPSLKAQSLDTVYGVVKDEQGLGLPGAAVMEKGTTNGTITDIDGNFTIDVKNGSVLEFSSIGFKNYEMTVTGPQNVEIVMQSDVELLEQVVVVGYGVQKKVNLTGSISTVNFDEEMSSRPVPNASAALAGVSSGVAVTQTSGKPGSDGAAIRVRGNGTLNSNGPLVLVDGIEWDMNNVNTEDIASITILKDAASAAIYGSRAANGVILVTTKSGKGKTKVNYSFIGSLQTAQNNLALVSDYATHMKLINEGCQNVDSQEVFAPTTIAAWEAARQNPMAVNSYGVPNYIAYPNTDWFDEIIGNGFQQKHNLSVQGGNEKSNWFVSLGYQDTDGIMNEKGLDSGMEQVQLRTNVEYKVAKWLDMGTRINGVYRSLGMADIANGFEYLHLTTPGIYPGTANKWGQPAAVEESTTANNIFGKMSGHDGYDKVTRINLTAYAKVRPYDGLSLEFSYNYAPDFAEYAAWSRPNGTWNYIQDKRVNNSSLENATIKNESRKTTRMNTEALARYANEFGDGHDIGVLAGFTTSTYHYHAFSVMRKGMADWSLHTLNTGATLSNSSSSEYDWSLMSFFGRVNYAYKSRYLFEANLRCDGSSRFAPESRWGYFPSFSAGWVLSRERFMEMTSSWLSNLKIRASWGMLGNNASGNYDWQTTYETNKGVIDGVPATGLAVTKLGNEALVWESTKITNIGIDFGFFGDRLSGEFEGYHKLTSGILYTPSIPITMGNVKGATKNIAAVRNMGIELSLGWRDTVGDFFYSVKGNYSFNANKVVKYKGKLKRFWNYDSKGYPTTFSSNYGDVAQSGFGGVIMEDRMMGEYYLRKVYRGDGSYKDGEPGLRQGPKDGMIRTESDMEWVRAMIAQGYTFNGVSKVAKNGLWYGDLIYEDANGDGNYGDTNDMNLVGTSSTPLYNFGLEFSLSWKGLDFYMLWAGSAGFDLYWNHAIYNSSQTSNGRGISKRVADDHYFYDPSAKDDLRTNIYATFPRLRNSSQGDNGLQSDFWLYKGDYFKLKNAQIGYTFPKKWMEKIRMDKIRVYLSGENLLTITQFPGLDPEIGTSVGYPLIRQYAVGLQVSF